MTVTLSKIRHCCLTVGLYYIADMAVGFIVIPNMIAILLLSPKFFEIFHGYLADLKRKERS